MDNIIGSFGESTAKFYSTLLLEYLDNKDKFIDNFPLDEFSWESWIQSIEDWQYDFACFCGDIKFDDVYKCPFKYDIYDNGAITITNRIPLKNFTDDDIIKYDEEHKKFIKQKNSNFHSALNNIHQYIKYF